MWFFAQVFLALALAQLLSACSPAIYGRGDATVKPSIKGSVFITADEMVLPIKRWHMPDKSPDAVIVALHGFNDYSNAFHMPGHYLAEHYNIATYAYDQRGFGDTANRGTWAGTETYIKDLNEFCLQLRERYPGTPLYVLGESMGGAITMSAFTSTLSPNADGVILVAPAVWARKTMPWYQRSALFLGAHLFPWLSLTGEGVVTVAPSDNRDMLIAFSRDPLVIKETKVAAMYGLTNVMDQALERSAQLDIPALVLIADQDDIVPNRPSAMMVKQLAGLNNDKQVVVYKQGYHMLLRDLQGQRVWEDIAAWVLKPEQPLPSSLLGNQVQSDLQSWMTENLN